MLEAIDIISRGRSFRTSLNSHLINTNSSSYKIHAEIDVKGEYIHRIGLEWARSKKKLKLDGAPIHKQSAISKLFPVRTMNPHGDCIVTGTPKQKRSHIDWGVFHVKPGFNVTLQHYLRVLDQKNSALKNGVSPYSTYAWDAALAKLANHIDCERNTYINELNVYLSRLSNSFGKSEKLQIEYKRGWPRKSNLFELLKSRSTRFESMGHVDVGPHLADYEILLDGKSAKIYASGGQRKLTTATFILAQVKMLQDGCGKQVTFLVDDLPSELDKKNRSIFLQVLNSWNVQVFATLHDKESLPRDLQQDHKLFHVKHGVVQEL